MEVILYKYDGLEDKVGKTLSKYILDIFGSLREGTSLLSPSILIESGNYTRIVTDDKKRVGYLKDNIFTFITNNQLEQLLQCNYCYIPEFKRYYWVSNIISVRSNLWRIDLNIDVLNSYAEEIKKQECYVSRNEYNFDYKQEDPLLVYSNVVNNYIYEPDKGELVNFEFDVTNSDSGTIKNCTVTVINSDASGYYNIKRPKIDGLDLPRTDITWEQPISNSLYVCDVGTLRGIRDSMVKTDFSKLSSGIVTMVQFPFTIPTSGYDYLTIFDTKMEGITVWYCNTTSFKNYILADFTFKITDNGYYYYSKGTFLFYIPYLGYVNISPQDFINDRIVIFYNVDYSSGLGIVNIYNYTKKRLIYYSECRLGRTIPVTSTNYYNYRITDTINDISTQTNVILAAATTTLGIATANPFLTAAGISNGVKTALNHETTYLNNYMTGSSSVNTTSLNALQPQNFFIKCTVPEPVNVYEITKTYGRPLNTIKLLSTLTGRTICSNVQLSNIPNATKPELEKIKSKLETGVYL